MRDRPQGFRGGIGRWVAAEEARALVEEVSALDTTGDLRVWRDSSPLAPWLRSGAGRAFVHVIYGTAAGRRSWSDADEPLTDEDRAELVAVAVVEIADSRRHAAIVEHARGRAMPLPAAVGIDGTGRSLARCPTCDAPINLGHEFGFYCFAHHADCDRDVAELLGGDLMHTDDQEDDR